MVLGNDAQAIIDALNQSLGSRLDTISGQVTVLSTRMSTTEASVSQVQVKLSALEHRVGAMESGSGAGSSTSTAAPGRSAAPKEVNKNDRKIVILGGWEQDTDRETIDRYLRDNIIGKYPGLTDAFAIGKYSNRARLTFENPDKMWGFMRALKGKKFSKQGGIVEAKDVGRSTCFWHSVDKQPWEITRARRVGVCIRKARELFVEGGNTIQEAEQRFDPDYDGGFIRYRAPPGQGANSHPIRLLSYNRVSEMMERVPQVFVPGGAVDLDLVVAAQS